MKSYQGSLAISNRLAKADPNNAGWQRELSVSYNDVGGVQVKQGNLAEALKSYQAGLAIAESLAKADPKNAGWQSDLAYSHQLVGNTLIAQGSAQEGIKSLQDGLAHRERLAKADPSNTGWQVDLAASYESIGDALYEQGNILEAMKYLQGSFAILQRLAQAAPGNADWQRNLAGSYYRLATGLRRQGKLAPAMDALGKGKEILMRLTALSPDNAYWKQDLGSFEEEIADFPYWKAKADIEAAHGPGDDIEAAFDRGDYAKAAAAQAKLTAAIKNAQRKKGKPSRETATAFLKLSWYRLFARDFSGAQAASDRAIALSPAPIYAMGKAHALMFLGRPEEARALYLRYKGQPLIKDGWLWEAGILDHFEEFEKRGLKHRQMAEIKALLAAK